VAPPDFELRTAILLIKARARKKDLSMNVAKLLAANITDNRKLEGVLIKLFAKAENEKQEVTEDFARSVLGEKTTSEHKKVTAEEFMRAVCDYFDIKPSALKGDKRDRPIAQPRQILMYLLRREISLPYMEIGGILGGRDHTTIIHGEAKIADMMVSNTRIREDVEKIKERVFK